MPQKSCRGVLCLHLTVKPLLPDRTQIQMLMNQIDAKRCPGKQLDWLSKPFKKLLSAAVSRLCRLE